MRGEFHSPNLQEEYFPGEQFGDFILGGSGDWYAMDRLMFVRLLMAVLVAIFFVVAFRRPKLVPTGPVSYTHLTLPTKRIV